MLVLPAAVCQLFHQMGSCSSSSSISHCSPAPIPPTRSSWKSSQMFQSKHVTRKEVCTIKSPTPTSLSPDVSAGNFSTVILIPRPPESRQGPSLSLCFLSPHSPHIRSTLFRTKCNISGRFTWQQVVKINPLENRRNNQP